MTLYAWAKVESGTPEKNLYPRFFSSSQNLCGSMDIPSRRPRQHRQFGFRGRDILASVDLPPSLEDLDSVHSISPVHDLLDYVGDVRLSQ